MKVRFNGPQSYIHQRLKPGTTCITPWGRGVGKSHFQRMCWWESVAKYDGVTRYYVDELGQVQPAPITGIRMILLMPTFKHCVDVHGRAVLDQLEGDWAFLNPTINRTRMLVTFPGGSSLQFFGAENADSARGMRADFVTIDECDDVSVDVMDSVVAPWCSEPWSLKMKLMSGTPLRGRYGLLFHYHDGAKHGFRNELGERVIVPGFHTKHATYREAPGQVDIAKVEELRATIDPRVFRREWECDFDAAEGLVYDLFDADFHVCPVVPGSQPLEIIVGVDYGYEDPTVILICHVYGHGKDTTVHLVHEFYKNKVTESDIAAMTHAYPEAWKRAKWFYDPSRPSLAEEIRRSGVPKIYPADNDIDQGVSTVADTLLKRRTAQGVEYAKLYIDPSCVNTIKEFSLYRRRRDPNDTLRHLDDIEDRNNHAMDALRYAIYTRFGAPEKARVVLGDGVYGQG